MIDNCNFRVTDSFASCFVFIVLNISEVEVAVDLITFKGKL